MRKFEYSLCGFLFALTLLIASFGLLPAALGTHAMPRPLFQTLVNGQFGGKYAATGLTANVTAAPISFGAGTNPAGRYEAFCNVILTVVGSSSSTLPSCTVNYTDADTAVAKTLLLSATSAANTLGASGAQTPGLISSAAASAITVTTASYASSAAGATYSIHFRVIGPE
jgi:hypothetical protein